jgi:NADPH:quinone reductase-like Zn-dependent oxidoreductase
VNHRTDSWPAEVRRITSKKGVDIIVEHIGGSILESCFHCLARGGTVVTCGATAGKDIHLNLWPFFVKEQRLTGSYGRTREDFLRTIDWLLEGRIRPVIDSIFPLEDAMAAMAKLRDGRALGKVLVAP